MKLKYVGPHSAVDLPGVGVVERGATAEVTGEQAKSLEQQTGAWERVDTAKKESR